MSYLLDTCIVSKLRKIKARPDPKLEAWVNKHSQSHFFLSVITIGEIQSGIAQLRERNAEERRQKRILEDWLFSYLIPQFNLRILEIDNAVALTWGKILGTSKQHGNHLPAIDALIAATAMVHQLIVVTENIRHFENSGARCFNPYE